MSQRVSGYDRKERDLYETPEWVTDAVLPHLPAGLSIWEPACGSGKMLRALRRAGHAVVGTDIETGDDYLAMRDLPFMPLHAVVTNPPFNEADEFIAKALHDVKPFRGVVAMLLRVDYDSAKTRQHLFGGCQQFSKKIVLTKRIVWFERPGAAPSSNHAWFLWDWTHRGAPTISYGPDGDLLCVPALMCANDNVVRLAA